MEQLGVPIDHLGKCTLESEQTSIKSATLWLLAAMSAIVGGLVSAAIVIGCSRACSKKSSSAKVTSDDLVTTKDFHMTGGGDAAVRIN